MHKAVEAYEKYIAAGSRGLGGLLALETRKRVARSIEQHKNNLIALQSAYNGKHGDSPLPNGTDCRGAYAARKDRIWMDNLQEIRRSCRNRQSGTKRFSRMSLS